MASLTEVKITTTTRENAEMLRTNSTVVGQLLLSPFTPAPKEQRVVLYGLPEGTNEELVEQVITECTGTAPLSVTMSRRGARHSGRTMVAMPSKEAAEALVLSFNTKASTQWKEPYKAVSWEEFVSTAKKTKPKGGGRGDTGKPPPPFGRGQRKKQGKK
jgi:hypothetical protein